MARAFYPGLAADAASDARGAADAVKMVKAGLRDELAELKRTHAAVKKAKPVKMCCVDPGAGQPKVCVPGNARGALKKAKAERKRVEKSIASAIKSLEKRIKKVK